MTKRNYLTILILALIFVAPSLTAFLYYRNPQWLGTSTTNKGALLNPPILFSSKLDNKSKWRLILWYPQNCETECAKEVDKLARVRLALGRHLYEVDTWLAVMNESGNQLPVGLTQTLQEHDIHLAEMPSNELTSYPILGSQSKIFIANPQGYLVLSYDDNAKPEAIYNDIKRLLSTDKTSG